jgi:hypothetical protein
LRPLIYRISMVEQESQIVWPISFKPWVEPPSYSKMVSIHDLPNGAKQILWTYLRQEETGLARLIVDAGAEAKIRVYLKNPPDDLKEWIASPQPAISNGA